MASSGAASHSSTIAPGVPHTPWLPPAPVPFAGVPHQTPDMAPGAMPLPVAPVPAAGVPHTPWLPPTMAPGAMPLPVAPVPVAHTWPGVVDDPGGDNLFENVLTLNDRVRILEHAVFGPAPPRRAVAMGPYVPPERLQQRPQPRTQQQAPPPTQPTRAPVTPPGAAGTSRVSIGFSEGWQGQHWQHSNHWQHGGWQGGWHEIDDREGWRP